MPGHFFSGLLFTFPLELFLLMTWPEPSPRFPVLGTGQNDQRTAVSQMRQTASAETPRLIPFGDCSLVTSS